MKRNTGHLIKSYDIDGHLLALIATAQKFKINQDGVLILDNYPFECTIINTPNVPKIPHFTVEPFLQDDTL